MRAPKVLALVLALAVATSAFVLLGMVSTAAVLSYGNYGTQVGYDSSDYAPRFTLFTNARIARQDAGGAGIQDDLYFIHFGASTDTTAGPADLTLTGTSKGTFATQGTTFNAVDTDLFESDLRYLEADGKPGYTPGDFLYYSDDTILAAETAGFADIQLWTGTALTPSTASQAFGTIVVGASTDLVEAADTDQLLPDDGDTGTGGVQFTTTPAATFVFKWTDRNANGIQDTADPLVVSAAPANEQTFYVIGDTWLNTIGEGSMGTRVTSSTTKEIPTLADLSTTALLAEVSHGNPVATRHLFFHFPDPDTSENHILPGDIVLFESLSGATYGTRVTATTNGLGESITATTNLQALIYYVEVDGIAGYTTGDPVYLNRPATAFGGDADALGLTKNDVRLTPYPATGSATYAAGTIVAETDTDRTTYGSATANPVGGRWYLSRYNADRSNEVPLTLVTNGKIRDANSNGDWDAGEGIYIDLDSSGTITAGDVRVTDFGANTDSDTATRTLVVGADTDDDGAPAIIAPASGKKQVYITGNEATFTAGRSQYIYLSVDAFANARDIRGWAHAADVGFTAGSTVAAGNADTTHTAQSSVDRLFASWCLSSSIGGGCLAGTPPLLLHIDDVEIVSGATKVAATGSDHVPWLQLVTEDTATQRLARWSRADPAVVDDVFYMAVLPGGAPTVLNSDDLRVSGLDSSNPAGKAVGSNAAETGATAITFTTGAGGIYFEQLQFIDTDSNGYDAGDFVVIDLPAALGGTNVGTYGVADVRLTPTGSTAGATTYAAGTMRLTADSDNIFTTFGANSGANDLHVYWFDKNRDGTISFENIGEDIAYIMYNTGGAASQSVVITPLISSVRHVGAGGATSSGANLGSTPTTVATPAPSLSGGTASAQCVAASASVTFTVVYSHSQGLAPTTANLIFNSVTTSMTTSQSTYTTGATYTATVSAPATAGSYSGTFSFSNSGGTATLATPTVTVVSSTAAAPTLSLGSVSPTSGAAGATFAWTVTYTDTNNDAPTVREVLVDGVAHEMTSSDTTYCNGAIYTYSQTLSNGTHNYIFKFKDASTEVLLPSTGTSSGPTVGTAATTSPTSGSPGPSANTTSPGPTTTKKPTPGFELFVLAAAAVGTVWVVRRRSQ